MCALVSILIPAFNAERWIAETIESALQQTWPRTEIIVVDDGSSDRTLSIASRFASRNVKVFRQANEGAAAARNRAFDLSQGDLIQWLDADDLLAPDKISQQMKALERCDGKRTLLSCAWGDFIHRVSKAKFTPSLLWCDLSPADWLIRKMEHGAFMQTATWLVPRALTEKAGPWDTRLLGDDDGEYFCRVISASDMIKFVSDSRIYYRRTGYNRLSYAGRSQRKLHANYLSLRLHIEHLRAIEDSPRARAASVRFLQENLFYFYPEMPDIVCQARDVAQTLGGRLDVPRLPRKYQWIQKTFGWRVAKDAQLRLPQLKWAVIAEWDKAMFTFERQRASLGLTRFAAPS
jgi:glycosyltransferase involved in cell wall biosynthesis